jgi:hypothetical protein
MLLLPIFSPLHETRATARSVLQLLRVLDKAKFAASFASDGEANAAEFMANSQVPWGVDALARTISDAACRT